MSPDPRRHAPATVRNRDAILDVLRRVLPAEGLVLEIASGTGEHVVHFARTVPTLTWQPSDPDPMARESIAEWAASEERAKTVLPPLDLDVDAGSPWPLDHADAVLCINMVHIAPWSATEGLFAGARRVLAPGSPLVLYGPFRRDDVPLEPSNAAFDRSLRERDPRWGLRDLGEVAECAGRTVSPSSNSSRCRPTTCRSYSGKRSVVPMSVLGGMTGVADSPERQVTGHEVG